MHVHYSREHAATRCYTLLGAGPRAADREEALRAGAPPCAEAGVYLGLRGTVGDVIWLAADSSHTPDART
jgi:hypothetical protein